MLRHHTPHILLLTSVLISLSLTGCAALGELQDGAKGLVSSIMGDENPPEPPAPLIEFQPEVAVDVLWQEQIGAGKANQNLKLDIALSGENLFVADREGLVQARASNNGQLLWEVNTEQTLSAGPGLGSNTLILGSSDAKVTALDNATGEQLWSSKVSSEVLAMPVVANGVVVIRTTDSAVVALDEKTGKKLWGFEETLPPLILRGAGKPLIIKDRVIVGFANGKVVALQLNTGKNLWETTVAMPSGRSEVERLVDLISDPIEKDGVIYITSYHGGTSAVNAADGNMLWRTEQLSSAAGLSADGRYLCISDNNSDVWQIDPRTGATLWKQVELHYRVLTAPLAYEEYVVVGDFEGYVHWLSRSDGRQMGRVRLTKSAIDSVPVVANDVIYVYAKDGTLAALKARIQ